jgi:voltage-gated potassium channel
VHHRHSALLASIVIALEVRPLIVGENPTSHLAFGIAMVAMFIVALYTIQVDELAGERKALIAEKRRRSLVGWALASGAIIERLASLFAPSFTTYVVGAVCWVSFVSFITWSQFRAVLRQKEITSETISMSISVYLLLGLSWALLYGLLNLLQPHAFSFPSTDTSQSGRLSDPVGSTITIMIYFSFTTLTTVGYGDITPVTLQARYAAIAEGIMGVFYIAIMVARLVAMQISPPATNNSENQAPAFHNENGENGRE